MIAQCQPVHALWDLTSMPRKCIDLKSFFVGSGIPNVLLNSVILVLPLPMVWTLEIERKHKLALSGVFLLGGFVVIVSIIRVIVLSQMVQVDITWTLVDGAIWTTVEPAVAVVSACLPIMRSLWIWNREKSEARRSHAQDSTLPSQKKVGQNPTQTDRKQRRHSRNQHPLPLNELPADTEIGWGTKTDINSDYTASTTRVQDSPAYFQRTDLSKSPVGYDQSAYQPNTVASNGHSRSTSKADSNSDSSGKPQSSLPIQRNEATLAGKPQQDLSGFYFPGKRDDDDQDGNSWTQHEPAELYGSAHVP